MWPCDQCTFRNQDDADRCEICDGARPSSASPAAAASPSRKRARPGGALAHPASIGFIDQQEEDDVIMTDVRPSPPIMRAQSSPVVRPQSSPSATAAASSSIAAAASPVPAVPKAASIPSPIDSLTALVRAPSMAASKKAELKAEAAAERQRLKAAKLTEKAEMKLDKELTKMVTRACKGAHAEEEVHVVLHRDFRASVYAKLPIGLREAKFSFAFGEANNAPPAVAAAAASSSSTSAASIAPSSLPSHPSIPLSVCFHRRQAPSVVAEIRARKRLKGGSVSEWRTLEGDALERSRREHDASMPTSAEIEELPPPAPIRTVVCLVDGATFLWLYNANQLQSTLDAWLDEVTRQDANGTLLLTVFNLYSLVQMEANRALQDRRAETAAAAASGSPASRGARPAVKSLRKLTDVDALLAQIWFNSHGRIRFKAADSLSDCLEWLVHLTGVLAKSPYKEVDTALSVVSKTRTNAMRGGDDFVPRANRASPSDDDSEEDAGGSADQPRRKPTHSTMGEAWRLYLMQVPRMSERIAVCITKAYPTFRRLWQAYDQCATDKQREQLVQDLPVNGAAVAIVPNARVARVGPAMSKALYQAIWLQTQPTETSPPGQQMEEDS